MVEQIREKISKQRAKFVPGLFAMALLSGLIFSIVSTPNATADYYTGCGYGYNASGGGFGYGTGIGHGYGYNLSHQFGFGYGYQVCPPTTTTTVGGGGGGGGGGTTTTTTTTTPTSTTTAPVTTTTAAPGRKHLFGRKAHGYAIVGRSVRFAITGGGFYGHPKVTSNEPGTTVGVEHDYGNVLIVKVTIPFGSPKGWYTLTIREPDGKSCKVNYLVK